MIAEQVWGNAGGVLMSNTTEMKLEELLRRLVFIKEIGWIRSTVPAPKNVGELLEALLGLQTNSFKEPDWGKIEVKSKRRNAKNNVTLTTKVPVYKDKMSAREFTQIYGYDKPTGKALQCTLYSLKRNSQDWKLIVHKSHLDIDYNGQVLGSISLIDVKKQFQEKLGQMVFMVADSEIRGKWEYFHFAEAYFCNDIKTESIRDLLKTDDLVFEFRMRWKNGEFKDYGPAYRISEDNLHKLYSNKIKIV